jgi:hypothetical protein
VYRSLVGKPEYTPPDLQGYSFADVDRQPEHDAFALAVLIFRLLMEGFHPFDGVYRGRGEPPELGARIRNGYFPYARGRTGIEPSPLAPPFEMLHPDLQALFVRCFEEGHRNRIAFVRVWRIGWRRWRVRRMPCNSVVRMSNITIGFTGRVVRGVRVSKRWVGVIRFRRRCRCRQVSTWVFPGVRSLSRLLPPRHPRLLLSSWGAWRMVC